jgi:hypothetical protein
VNCQETSHLLDATARDALTLMQCEAIDRHLASCPACRADWTNWGEIVDLPVPPTPATLRGRIMAALPAQRAAPARRAFRPYVVGGVLLVGMGLAAALTLHFSGRAEPPAARAVLAEKGLPPSAPAAVTGFPAQGTVPEVATQATAKEAAKAVEPVDKPLDPHSIVVLKRPEATADPQAIALAGRCQDSLVSELRTFKGLKVLTADAVYTTSSFEELIQLTERDRRIARALGAGRAVVVSTEGGCHVTLFDTPTGAMVQGAGGSGVAPQGDAERFGRGMAHGVRDKTLFDTPALLAEARTMVLDTSLGDRERVGAFFKPQSLGLGRDSKALRDFYDAQVLAAAATIGVKSADTQVREAVWATMRNFREPLLVQPMLQVLASDPEASVRYQVAFDLHAFLDQPGVLEALQRAATGDPSAQSMHAGAWSVREAAERAAIADKDFNAWVLARLLDEKLPARARLLNAQASISPDGRFINFGERGAEAARAVFEIGRREQDPQVRTMAWNTLWMGKTDEAYVPVMLDDLARHPDDVVRMAAVNVLDTYFRTHGDNADVRAALERARSDQSMEVRRRASWALEQAARR